MNDNSSPAEPEVPHFPTFQNVSQATRFLRNILGPNVRVKTVVMTAATLEPVNGFGVFLNGKPLTLGGPTINDALELGFKVGVIPNTPPTKAAKRPRKLSAKMLARRADGKTKGALGPKGRKFLADLRAGAYKVE